MITNTCTSSHYSQNYHNAYKHILKEVCNPSQMGTYTQSIHNRQTGMITLYSSGNQGRFVYRQICIRSPTTQLGTLMCTQLLHLCEMIAYMCNRLHILADWGLSPFHAHPSLNEGCHTYVPHWEGLPMLKCTHTHTHTHTNMRI